MERPYQLALYSIKSMNFDQLASAMCLDSFLFRISPFTFKSSKHITWFSLISFVESLCKKSFLLSAILACSLATFFEAFKKLLDLGVLSPLNRLCCFLDSLFWSLASLRECFAIAFNGLYLIPSLVIAKSVKPTSIPTDLVNIGLGSIASSTKIETKYLLLPSFS